MGFPTSWRRLSKLYGPKCRNLLLVAAQGLGKTLLARNIAHAAVLQGYSALFIEASRMLLDLGAQDSARSLERRLRHYAKPALLCIDEVGYLSYDARAADLLFEVVSRRYEQKSIVITTNLAFQDWPSIFPNASCVTALDPTPVPCQISFFAKRLRFSGVHRSQNPPCLQR